MNDIKTNLENLIWLLKLFKWNTYQLSQFGNFCWRIFNIYKIANVFVSEYLLFTKQLIFFACEYLIIFTKYLIFIMIFLLRKVLH